MFRINGAGDFIRITESKGNPKRQKKNLEKEVNGLII
jgi:hypothetical protein